MNKEGITKHKELSCLYCKQKYKENPLQPHLLICFKYTKPDSVLNNNNIKMRQSNSNSNMITSSNISRKANERVQSSKISSGSPQAKGYYKQFYSDKKSHNAPSPYKGNRSFDNRSNSKDIKEHKKRHIDSLKKELEKEEEATPFDPYKLSNKYPNNPQVNLVNEYNGTKSLPNQEKYQPNAKVLKPLINPQQFFLNKLNQEIKKDKINLQNSKEKILCFLCTKNISLLQMKSHIKLCEFNWRMSYTTVEPTIVKPIEYDHIIKKINDTKIVSKDEINIYNEKVLELQKNIFTSICPICAKSIIFIDLEKHKQTCKASPDTKQALQPKPDPKKLFEEKVELEVKEDKKYIEENKEKIAQEHLSKSKEKNKWNKKTTGTYDFETFIQEEEKQRININTYEKCLHCKRKFLPERLQVHLRSCKEKY